MLADLGDRVRAIGHAAARTSPVPFGTRCAVYLAGLVSLLVAYPGWMLFTRPGMLLLLVAPVLPAVLPKGRATTAVVLLAVVCWLAGTTIDGAPVRLWRVLALAGALYLLHSLAALAAALPYDAVVQGDVIIGWLGRALLVILAAAVLAVLALAAAAGTGDRPVLAAALLGLAIAVALTALTAVLATRRPPR